MICQFCQYAFRARVDQPKKCPRCGNRLDRPGYVREPWGTFAHRGGRRP